MKIRFAYLIIPALLLVSLFVNSCKKQLDSDIPDLLVNGTWQLSSVRVTISRGDTIKYDSTYTVNLCTQNFTFSKDKTCTYTNFDCIPQETKGAWDLRDNRLTLVSNIMCKDTAAASGGTSKPFIKCAINSLGRYSMVLLTGDYINYNNSAIRRVVRYGFVRQNPTNQ